MNEICGHRCSRNGHNLNPVTVHTMTTRLTKRPIYLTVQERLEILMKLEDGFARSQLAKAYNVNTFTIRRIELNAARIRQQSQIPEIQGHKRLQRPVLIELDARLYAWFLEQQARDDHISDEQLQEKAREINKELGGPASFTASKGLILRFKRRHGICLIGSRGKAACGTTAEEFSQTFLRRLEEENIKLQNVYNMAETSLMWKAVPKETLVLGEEIKKDRVTVGFCSNATGTHKLLPIIINKYEAQKSQMRCRNGLVTLRSLERTSVERNVFVDWFQKHFKPAVRRRQHRKSSRGKVLLLLDVCKARVFPPEKQKQEKNIEIVYMPGSATSILQPMSQGIIEKVKRSFRHRMLERILHSPGGVKEFYVHYDMKDCVNILNEVWADVTQFEICQSWQKILADKAPKQEQTQEDQEENFSTMSSVTAIAETVREIAGEVVPRNEIEKWLDNCNEVEHDSDTKDRDKEAGEESGSDLRTNVDQEEVKNMFKTLDFWSQSQPKFIKMQVRALHDSYQYTQR